MDESSSVRLTAPKAELESLSFAETTPEALAEWIAILPMANTSDTAGQVRQATFEIARVDLDWPERLALLEIIRPTLHYLCARLDRGATATSTHGDAIARLAQRLQTNLCSGFKSVILSALPESEDRKALEAISLSIHRSLSDLSRTLLRTLQFYVAPADRLWLELNQLYHLAEQLNLTTEAHDDAENHNRTGTTITDTYLRSVLLALSKPNQLRHRQLSNVFSALELWTPSTTVEPSAESELFCIDLGSDQGPRYTAFLTEPEHPRCVHMEVLVYELEAFLKDMDGTIPIPEHMDDSLIRHLADAWGEMKERSFRRASTETPMKVCVGLRAAHYFLSGGLDFADQVDSADVAPQSEINPFIKEDEVAFVAHAGEVKDVWDDAFDLRIRIPENPKIANPERLINDPRPKDKRGSYHFYDTTTVDTSPGGYRVRWNEPLPANVQTGELVAMRDESDPRWCIAVIRWIRQDGNGTYMGIELMAPRAIPIASRVIQTKGGPTEYARAFLLPELKPIGQPASLITPLMPFQSGQKVHFSRQGIQTTAQLGPCLLKTESFNQFTFRMLDGYLENSRINLNMDNPVEIANDQEVPSR